MCSIMSDLLTRRVIFGCSIRKKAVRYTRLITIWLFETYTQPGWDMNSSCGDMPNLFLKSLEK